MPSRVRVAGIIGGRVYFGRQITNSLRHVADSAGVLISNRKKGAAWEDVSAAWEVMGKYLDNCKLYVIRERRGLKASRSLFNHKLLGYRKKKKRTTVNFYHLAAGLERDWAVQVDDPPPLEEAVPAPAGRRLIGENEEGTLVYEPRNGN